jgi:hypothetical protein
MEDQEVLILLEKILKDSLTFGERFKSVKLTCKTRVREDLKLDFLDYYGIGYWLEEREKISIMEEIDDFVTIGDYVNCIKPKIEKRQKEKSDGETDEYYI